MSKWNPYNTLHVDSTISFEFMVMLNPSASGARGTRRNENAAERRGGRQIRDDNRRLRPSIALEVRISSPRDGGAGGRARRFWGGGGARARGGGARILGDEKSTWMSLIYVFMQNGARNSDNCSGVFVRAACCARRGAGGGGARGGATPPTPASPPPPP